MSPPVIANAPGPVAPVVEVGIGDRYDASAIAAVWDTARWSTPGDDNEWGGTEPLWNDVTCEALEIATYCGRDGSVETFNVGTATVVVRNLDGWADYKPAGPNDSLLTVRPGRQIRIGVAVGAGYWIPGVPAVPGYLTATVGTVSTPDPGPLPAECCFVFKVAGPTGTPSQVVVAQYDADPQRSWRLRRRGDNGDLVMTFAPAGTNAGSTARSVAYPNPTLVDEHIALAVQLDDAGQTRFQAYTSTNGTTWTPEGVQQSFAAVAAFDSNAVLRVGAAPVGVDPWDNRIYWCELRSGLNPAAGTVLWRFDADDYPGTGTGYTDPRGRTWTLTTAAAIIPKLNETPAVWVPPPPTAWLWRGVIDTTEPGYVPGEGDVVTIGCIDAKGDAGRAEIPKTLAPVGYGERGHQRCWRILDHAGWPRWRRNLDVDNVQLLATEFGAQAADELDVTAESCSGHVYGDLAGKIRFRRKDWMMWAATTPVDATIGNIGAGDVCPSGWEMRFGRDDLTTVAIVGRPGETPLVMTNSEAFGLYGNEPWNREDLLAADTFELARVGSRTLSARSPETMPRIAAVTLDAATGAGEVAALLAACSPFTPSRFRVRHTSAGRLVFDRTMMVVGVEHILSPVDGWQARVALDDAMPYRNVDNPARWSDPTSRWSTDDQWALSL